MYGDGGDAMMQVLSRVRHEENLLLVLQTIAMHPVRLTVSVQHTSSTPHT